MQALNLERAPNRDRLALRGDERSPPPEGYFWHTQEEPCPACGSQLLLRETYWFLAEVSMLRLERMVNQDEPHARIHYLPNRRLQKRYSRGDPSKNHGSRA